LCKQWLTEEDSDAAVTVAVVAGVTVVAVTAAADVAVAALAMMTRSGYP
jgi:hypothetical protein